MSLPSADYARGLAVLDPAIAAIDDPTLQGQIALYAGRFDPGAWGDRWADAVCLYALHRLRVASMAAATGALGAGPVQAESVGGLSVTYATPAAIGAGDADLLASTYGQRLVALARTRPARLPFVAGPV